MVRILTKSFVLSLDQKGQKLSTPSPILTACLIDGSLLIEDIQSGIDQMWPDWSSIRVNSYHPNTASVMCFVEEGEQDEGKAFRRCPRSRLREITQVAKRKHDIDLLVGMELEFFIIEEANGVAQPVKTVPHVYSAASLRNKYIPILEKIVQAFQKAGIEVRQFHSEGDSGCYEISTEPLPPLQSADALYFCQETSTFLSSRRSCKLSRKPGLKSDNSILRAIQAAMRSPRNLFLLSSRPMLFISVRRRSEPYALSTVCARPCFPNLSRRTPSSGRITICLSPRRRRRTAS